MWRDAEVEKAVQKVRDANIAAQYAQQECVEQVQSRLRGKIISYEHYGRQYRGRIVSCRRSPTFIVKIVVQVINKKNQRGGVHHSIQLSQISQALSDREYLRLISDQPEQKGLFHDRQAT